jgi:hypothetical protein
MFISRRLQKLFPLLVFLLALPFVVNAAPGANRVGPVKPSLQSFAKTPLSFEQHDLANQPAFLSRGLGYQMWLTPDESVITLNKPGLKDEKLSPAVETAQVRMKLMDANANPVMSGLDKQEAKSNYFIGNDKSKWKTGIDNYAKVKYEKVYPGIDLVYYGNQQKLEYDFLVRPGTDYKNIRMSFEGADQLTLDDMGNLILKTATGDLVQHAPVIYQEVDGKRNPVKGNYVLMAKNQVGFEVDDYDSRRTLVIDPVLDYASYFGGSNSDYGSTIQVIATGEIFVGGYTLSPDYPTFPDPPTTSPSLPFDDTYNALITYDNVIIKLDATGQLIYSTYLGGNNYDASKEMKVDAAGAVYMTGPSLSTDFPIVGGFQTSRSGSFDAFIVKLNPSGSSIDYSSYFGGGGVEFVRALALDNAGAVYIAGITSSNNSNFPLKNPLQSQNNGGSYDNFIAKINPAVSGANSLVYSTFLGGSDTEEVGGIYADSAGAVYIGGSSRSSGLATTGDTSLGGTRDGIIFKINPTGSTLDFATYLGGSGDDSITGIIVDSIGDIYVTGSTSSPINDSTESINFPNPNGVANLAGFVSPNASGSNAFVTKLSSGGSTLVYSSLIGGSGSDSGSKIAIGLDGRSYIVGRTTSSETTFPIFGATQPASGGSTDGTVFQLNPAGTNLEFSTFLGGAGNDYLQDIIFKDNKIYIVGSTDSTNITTVNNLGTSGNPPQSSNNGNSDILIAVISDLPAGSTDTEPPVISVVTTAITLEAGATYALVNDVGVTALDTIDGDLTASIVRGGATLPLNTALLGPQVITYNVSDAAGNAAVEKSRTVTIVDTTAPTCSPPADIITPTTGPLSTVAFGAATGSDVVGISSITNDAPTGGFPVGVTTITWTVTDTSSNFSQCTQTVTINPDSTLPVIVVNPVSVNAEAGSVYALAQDTGVTASDDVDGDLTASIIRTGATLPFSTNTVGVAFVINYNVSDSVGNAAVQKTRTVTIVDTTAPVCTAPADITTLATGTLTPVTIVNATATDFVEVVSITRSPLLNDFPVGTTVITFTATDAAGNSGTCSQNITINTIVAPFRGALVTRSVELPATSIDIPDRTMFHVPWDVVVYDYDQEPFFSSANPEVLKVPAGVSKIRLSGNFRFENLQNDESYRFLYIIKKGDPAFITAIASAKSTAFDPSGLVDIPAGIDLQQLQTNLNVTSPVLEVSQGDEFEVLVYQNSGQVIPLSRQPQQSWFSIEVIE